MWLFIFICILVILFGILLGISKTYKEGPLYDGYVLVDGEKIPLSECTLYYNQTHGYAYNKKINLCFPFTTKTFGLMKKYHPF